MSNKCKHVLYTNVPDDVYDIITEEQAKLKSKLKKHISVAYVISLLIRKTKSND